MSHPIAHITAIVVLSSLSAPALHPGIRDSEGHIGLVAHMRSGRAVQTATTIAGDRVLIAGGMRAGGSSIGTFEVFDARTNRIVLVGQMRETRAGHTATLLPDGRVLVVGGYNGAYLKSAEIFDARTGRFSPAGEMNEGRSGHTATLLADGTVLLAGGVGDGWSFLSSAEIFDPRAGRFQRVGSLSVPRESHTATLLPDGRVLVAGGHRDRRENIVVYASTEVYDPARRTFTKGPTLGIARHKHDAVALDEGRVLIVGGSDRRDRSRYVEAEVCTVTVGACTRAGEMRIGRYKVRDTAVRLRDGRILIAGGGRFAEIYDPRARVFRDVDGDIGGGYSFASAALLSTGDVLVIGGYDDSMRHSDGIWRFRE